MKFKKILGRHKLKELSVIIVGAFLSVAIYFAASAYELQFVKYELGEASANINVSLEAEIELSYELIRSIRGLFDASEFVSRKEFKVFVTDMLYRHNEIQALEWVPRILHTRRRLFEAKVRQENFPDFGITQRSGQGRMIPDRRRKEYFPVSYVEPLIGNESALGFNLGSSSSRLAALENARDTGTFVVTGRITLVQEKESESGFLIFYPVYKGKPGTVAERRKAILGFVLGVFRAGDLVTQAISRVGTSSVEYLNLEVYDESPDGELQLLYAKNDPDSVKSILRSSYSMSVGGRTWKVVHTAGQEYIDSHSTHMPLLLLIVTNVIALMLFVFVGARVKAARQRLDHEIRLSLFFDASMEGLFFYGQGRILDVNDSAASLIGYEPDEIIGKNLMDFIAPVDHVLALEKVQSNSIETWEMECIAKDGSCILVEVHADNTDIDGTPVRIIAVHDITERKIAERKVRTQNEFTERILDTVGSLVLVLDAKGRIVRFNTACEKLTGYSSAEVEGRQPWDFLLPVDVVHDVKKVFLNLMEGNFPNQHSNSWITKSGEEKSIEWSNSALVGDDGSVEFVIATGVDTTERIRMEENLTKERLRQTKLATELTLLIDNANAPIFGVNKLGRINEWNRKMAEITGYQSEDVMSCNFVDEFVNKEFKNSVKDILNSALAGNETENYELPLYAKAQHRVLMLLNATSRRDMEGNIIGVICIGQDITELVAYRTSMEQQVRERTQELQTIFILSPDGFVLISDEHKVVYVNPAFLEMTGMHEETVTGITETEFSEKIYALQDTDAQPKQFHIGKEEHSEILYLKRPAKKTIQYTLRSIKDDTGHAQGSVLYFRDITHEEEVDRMKTEFLSAAAHELRTPLASILGFSELLLNRDYDEAQRKDVTETIHRQSVNLKNLLDELLDLARIEARLGKDFNMQPDSLQGVFDEVCKEFKNLNPNRVIKKKIRKPWPVVAFDHEKMLQVIRNVMSNAYKYSAKDTNIECSTVRRKVNGELHHGIRIRDQGIGMSPETLARVGERFYRADAASAYEGTGLGITLVKEILAIHNGEMEFDSEVGEGTTVTIWLPILERRKTVRKEL